MEIKKEKIFSYFYWSKLKVVLEKKAIKDQKKTLISESNSLDQIVNEVNEENSKLINLGFDWNFDVKNANTILESSSDEEILDEDLDENKKKHREKKKIKTSREYEEYLRKKENELLDTQREPKTKDEFERMVISSPNSSLIWIKYMTMYIEQKLYDKAKQIGERALKIISFREEQEKLNIWVALMNIENEFGNEESFQILYRRAQMQNDLFKIFKALIKIYVSNEKFDKAEEAFIFHVKKLKFLKQFWLDYGVFLYKYNKIEKARNILEQSLKSLDKLEHVDIISKFAQLEFKCGDVERGKTLFENLLSTYPKRLDLWLIYIDVMQKYGRYEEDNNNACVQAIRNIFERVINLKFKVIRMKSIFKKYLDFENKFGNKATIERVKDKMKNYVNENPFEK